MRHDNTCLTHNKTGLSLFLSKTVGTWDQQYIDISVGQCVDSYGAWKYPFIQWMSLEEGGGGGRGDLKERVLRLWRDLGWGYAGGVWVTGRWGRSLVTDFFSFSCFHQLEKFKIQVKHDKFYNIICPQTHTFHQHDNTRADSRIQHFVHLQNTFSFWYLDLFKSRRLYHQLPFISNLPCEKSKYPNNEPFWRLDSWLLGWIWFCVYSPHHLLTIMHAVKWVFFIIIIKKTLSNYSRSSSIVS